MKLQEVNSAKLIKIFLAMPKNIYTEEDNYIRPLDQDIENIFSLEKNKLFKRGAEAIRWILFDRNDLPIGRLAAFVNPKYKNEQPTGGIGFFECINNQEAANFMFKSAEEWLKQRGMEAMDGSINFGERDKFWGLLVEGFQEPIYGMNYAKPYYQHLFEGYGFQVYFYQNCYGIADLKKKLADKFHQRYEYLIKDSEYSVLSLGKKDGEKFANDFCEIYNAAWASHGGGKEMDRRQALGIFNTMKPIIDDRTLIFAYHNNHPVGMWLNIPDINEIMKRFDGKFGIFQKLQFLYLLKRKICVRSVGLVFGISPSHQSKGVDGLLIIHGAKYYQSDYVCYKEYEMQWIGDFNPKMMNIAEKLNSQVSRKLATYRLIFDRSKPFARHKIL